MISVGLITVVAVMAVMCTPSSYQVVKGGLKPRFAD